MRPAGNEAILAAVTSMGAKLDKLTLHSAAAAPRTAATSSLVMSAASQRLVAAAMHKRRLTLAYADMPATTPAAFGEFAWGSLNEQQATDRLRAHFWAQLTAALPAGAHSLLPRGLAADCQIVDARRAPLALCCEYAPWPGVDPVLATVRGHPDAVVTLSSANERSSPSVLTYACAVIDWKTPAAMDSSAVEPQLVLETLALRPFTRRPVPVVATDCSTSMRVWLLVGRVLTEYAPPAAQGGAAPQGLASRRRLTLEEGCALLAQHLLPAAVAGAASQHRVDLATEDDGDDGTEDDGDSGDAGSELGGAGGSGGFLGGESHAGGGGLPPASGGALPGGPTLGGAASGGGNNRAALAQLPSSGSNQRLRTLLGPRAQKQLLAQFASTGFSVSDLLPAAHEAAVC